MKEFYDINIQLDDAEWWEENWETTFNLVGKTVGNYKILKKIKYLSYKSTRFGGSKYYLCQNILNNKYCFQRNLTIERLYRDSSPKEYFGVKYVDEDGPFHFSYETFTSVLERNKPNEFICRDKRKIKQEIEKYKFLVKLWSEKYASSQVGYYNCCQYLKTLDVNKFNDALNVLVETFGFKEVKDIKPYSNCLYIMVLDEYKQFYVGKCEGKLTDRIKKHWKDNMKNYCSPISGEYGRLGIDFFRMFDTTRIFVLDSFDKVISHPNFKNAELYVKYFCYCSMQNEYTELSLFERAVINSCPVEFSLNEKLPIKKGPFWEDILKKTNHNYSELTIEDYCDYLLNKSPKVKEILLGKADSAIKLPHLIKNH